MKKLILVLLLWGCTWIYMDTDDKMLLCYVCSDGGQATIMYCSEA